MWISPAPNSPSGASSPMSFMRYDRHQKLQIQKRHVMTAIVDCNSFYCSCERLFRPDLRDKPVVVLSNNDGCIISRSDEAQALGIGMAVPYFEAHPIIAKTRD